VHEKKFSLNINHIRVNHIIYIFFSYALQEVNDKRVREIVNREREIVREKNRYFCPEVLQINILHIMALIRLKLMRNQFDSV